MEEVIVLGIIAFIAIISAVFISIHLDKIRDQAYEDKKIVLHKWLVYAKLKLDYECGEGETIVCIDEVEEAHANLLKMAKWFNKKYRLYGYCIPPELLYLEEE